MATSAPSATVVIPTWNASATLPRALASIEGAVEILVVDDCSEDANVLRSIVDADPRVRLIAKVRRGNAAESRALGLAEAVGDVVLFLDADDAFRPGHIARRVALHRETGAGLILGRFRLDDGTGERDGPMAPYPDSDVAAYIFSGGGDARSSTLSVRRHALNGATFDPAMRKHQDWAFAIAAGRAGVVIGFDPEPGVVIHIAADTRMSRRSDVPASLAFMDRYLADPALARRFLIGRIRTSIRIGDIAAAAAFRRMLLTLRPTPRERLAIIALLTAARTGIARSMWRILSQLRRRRG